MTAPATIREADLRRILRALQAAGVPVSGVEMRPDRTVAVLVGRGERAEGGANPWDALEDG